MNDQGTNDKKRSRYKNERSTVEFCDQASLSALILMTLRSRDGHGHGIKTDFSLYYSLIKNAEDFNKLCFFNRNFILNTLNF